MEPIILLIASNPEIAKPFQAALRAHGFRTSIIGRSSTIDRAPRTEQYDLIVSLWETNQANGDNACPKSQSIDALFLVGNPASLKRIQTFQNGVYRLGAADADMDKFVLTIRDLLFDPNASCSCHEQPASSIEHPASSNQHPATKIKHPASRIKHPASSPLDLIGQSPKINEVRRLTKRLSRFPGVTVLIIGATGAGKEVVARLLHYSSSRAGKPFIPVNCGAIPRDLFESELFGHYKGAFTGAYNRKKGLIEAAQGGTLFLDEISSLTLE